MASRLARAGEGVTGEGDLLAVTFRVREAGSLVEVQATTVSSVGPGNRLLAAVPSLPHQMSVAR